MRTFKVTENHIKLLKRLYIGWNDMEWGGPCVDPKRPFGNSFLYGDMAEILGITLADEEENYEKFLKQKESLDKGWADMQDCLQILCKNLSIETGTYECDDHNNNWRKVDENNIQ